MNAKSEGDYPDFISHEISVMVAERLLKKHSFNLDIPTSTNPQAKEKPKFKQYQIIESQQK